jgi:hypothetical protein
VIYTLDGRARQKTHIRDVSFHYIMRDDHPHAPSTKKELPLQDSSKGLKATKKHVARKWCQTPRELLYFYFAALFLKKPLTYNKCFEHCVHVDSNTKVAAAARRGKSFLYTARSCVRSGNLFQFLAGAGSNELRDLLLRLEGEFVTYSLFLLHARARPAPCRMLRSA